MKKTDNIVKIFEASKPDFSHLPTSILRQNTCLETPVSQNQILKGPTCHQSNKPLQKSLLKTYLISQGWRGKPRLSQCYFQKLAHKTEKQKMTLGRTKSNILKMAVYLF